MPIDLPRPREVDSADAHEGSGCTPLAQINRAARCVRIIVAAVARVVDRIFAGPPDAALQQAKLADQLVVVR